MNLWLSQDITSGSFGSVDWTEILNVPLSFTPSSHSHAISDITNLQTTLDGKASSSHSHAISDITNLQTTLDGKASSNHTHLKLDITDLSVDWTEILNVPLSFTPSSHSHLIADITNLQTTLDGKASSSHTHTIANITNLQTTLDSKSDTTHNHNATYLALSGGTVSGFTTFSGGLKLVVQNATDGGNARGIFYWSANDYNWASYLSTAGAGKSLNAGTACNSLDGRTSHHIRHRAFTSTTQGFLWENHTEVCLMSLTSDTGNLYTKGTVNSATLAGTGNRAVYSDSTGTLTNTSSDRTLKTNIESLNYSLSDVLNLNPVSFNWINSDRFGTQKEIGLIAQEVQEICPEVIGTNSDGTLSLDYPKLVAVLINAIKELSETKMDK